MGRHGIWVHQAIGHGGGTQLLRAILLGTSISAIATLSATPANSIPSAAQQFKLDGPYPIRQRIRVTVPSVQFFGQGDTFSSAEGHVTFSTLVCEPIVSERADQLGAAVGERFDFGLRTSVRLPFGTPDCAQHAEFTRDYHGVDSGDLLTTSDVAFQLPAEPVTLHVDRLRGEGVVVNLEGIETDVVNDDSIGNLTGAFTANTNFGAGAPPEARSGTTCAMGSGAMCFQSSFDFDVEDEPTPPDRRVRVTAVSGPDEGCGVASAMTLGVTVANAEDVESQPYAVFMQVLDPSTRVAGSPTGYSTVQAPLGSHQTSAGISVQIQLTETTQRLVVYARAAGSDPGEMADAAEFSVSCLGPTRVLLPIDLEQPLNQDTSDPPPAVLPTSTPSPGVRRPVPALSQPTPTATSSAKPVRKPGIE